MLRASEPKPWDTAPQQFYQRQDIPGSTRFPVKCHPQADKVCEELDNLFYEHWPWRNEPERDLFFKAEHNKWACMTLPLVKDDRIVDAVKANTLIFLLDGTSILRSCLTIRERLISTRDQISQRT